MADDRRDRTMLDALRVRKVVTSGLRIRHIPGPKDALLWVADVVCGAVTQDRIGEDQYIRLLAGQIDVITIAAG